MDRNAAAARGSTGPAGKQWSTLMRACVRRRASTDNITDWQPPPAKHLRQPDDFDIGAHISHLSGYLRSLPDTLTPPFPRLSASNIPSIAATPPTVTETVVRRVWMAQRICRHGRRLRIGPCQHRQLSLAPHVQDAGLHVLRRLPHHLASPFPGKHHRRRWSGGPRHVDFQ